MTETSQVNVRLPPDRFEILEAAAFAQRTTPAILLTEAAEEFIDGLAGEAPVQAALSARSQADAVNERRVRPIKGRRAGPTAG